MLLWRSSHPRHTVICRALVERAVVVREEDTIRDLIRDTFQVCSRVYLARGGGREGFKGCGRASYVGGEEEDYWYATVLYSSEKEQMEDMRLRACLFCTTWYCRSRERRLFVSGSAFGWLRVSDVPTSFFFFFFF